MTDAQPYPRCGGDGDGCGCGLRWPHTSAMLHEGQEAALDAWYSNLLAGMQPGAYTIPDVDESGWTEAASWYFAPMHPAAFTTEGGRLTLVTR